MLPLILYSLKLNYKQIIFLFPLSSSNYFHVPSPLFSLKFMVSGLFFSFVITHTHPGIHISMEWQRLKSLPSSPMLLKNVLCPFWLNKEHCLVSTFSLLNRILLGYYLYPSLSDRVLWSSTGWLWKHCVHPVLVSQVLGWQKCPHNCHFEV